MTASAAPARRGRPGYDAESLLAVAVEVFNERGYDGTSFSANELFHYGFLRAQVGSAAEPLAVYSVHLSADLSAGVEDIRAAQARELADEVATARSVIGGDFNAEPKSPVIGTLLRAGLQDAAAKFLNTAAARLGWSARSTHRALKVARTIADLAGAVDTEVGHVAEAVQYRRVLRHPA